MMQAEVNKIVYNALIEGRDIWFPGVGSLVLGHRSAWRSSPKRLERPVRRVAFLSERKGVSLVDLIAEAGGCDRVTAESLYTRWLDKTRNEKGLSIAGVGVLEHKWFTPDPNLDMVLNPLGHDAVVLKPRAPRAAVTLVVSLLLLGAVGYGVWWLKSIPRTDAASEIEVAQQEPVPEKSTQRPSVGFNANLPETQTTGAGIETARATDRMDSTRPVQPEQRDSIKSEPETKTAPRSLTVERMTSGRTYAVWGVFSTEANARRAVAELEESHPELLPRIYHYGAKWMVSLRESDSEEEIQDYINHAGADMKGVWPYSKR